MAGTALHIYAHSFLELSQDMAFVRPLLFWMILLFSISTAAYVGYGLKESLTANINYSVLAFAVAPPDPAIPSEYILRIIVMIETFFGTLSTVLLGYILGNREQF